MAEETENPANTEAAEFHEQYATLSKDGRCEARKALEAEIRLHLKRIYGGVWSAGKIAVKASKMVDESMRAQNAAQN